jgi:hypothetical protein
LPSIFVSACLSAYVAVHIIADRDRIILVKYSVRST